jgi:hypothetical protein
MKYLILFSLILFFLACRKTPIEPRIEETQATAKWALHPGFRGEAYNAYALYPTESQLLVLGDNSVTTLDSHHNVIRQEVFSPSRELETYSKVHTNGKYFVYISRDRRTSWLEKISIRSVKNPKLFFELNIRQVDTNFRMISLDHRLSVGVLTADNRLFLSINYANDPQTWIHNSVTRLVSFKIQEANNQLTAILEPIFYPLNLTPPNLGNLGVLNLYQAKPNDRYLYMSSYGTYQFDLQTGRYSQIADICRAEFGYRNDTLWALGYHYQNRYFSFAFLPPNQSEWSRFESQTEYNSPTWHFTGKDILPVYLDYHMAVFEPQLDSNRFRIRSLTDNNISQIREIKAFRDRVYMASSQGLLFKPVNGFIK